MFWRWSVLLVPLFLASCGFLIDALSDEDISQYIDAYDRLAKISPQLKEAQEKSGSPVLLACSRCRELMDEAVKEAGYSGLNAFLLMDLRISYTMRHVAYLKLTQVVSGLSEEVSRDGVPEKACSDIANLSQMPESKEKARDYCRLVAALSNYIEMLSGYINGLSETLMQVGDIEMVNGRFDEIFAATTDERLFAELNHLSSSGEWDD